MTVLFVNEVLRVPLPLLPVFGVILVTALTNVGLHLVSSGVGENERFLAMVLGLDVVLLTLMLHWTGGPYNPFSTLYLVLVALSAVALSPGWTWGIAGFTGLMCAGLFLAPGWMGRPGDPVCGVGPNLPMSTHLWGMLVAFALTAGLVAFFVGRLQWALRSRDEELMRARERSIQHERFAALATLAAGAAHELGTPLGTIVVAAGELARDARAMPDRPGWVDDAELIRREAFRCRAILDRLQYHAEDAPKEIELGGVVSILRHRFPGVAFETSVGGRAARLVAPPEALTQALSNLIGNALDATPEDESVRVEITTVVGQVEFRVTDRGAGLTDAAAAHAGEPFFTTKPAGRGMGLGLFLVRLLARRLAGDFRFETATTGGTCAVLRLPIAGGGAPS